MSGDADAVCACALASAVIYSADASNNIRAEEVTGSAASHGVEDVEKENRAQWGRGWPSA